MTAPLLTIIAAGTALAGAGGGLLLGRLRRKARLPPGPPPDDTTSFSIWDLRAGRTYTVARTFTDSHGQIVEAGQRLTFIKADFLPYHSGHTLFFAERTIRLSELDRGDIIDSIDRHLQA